MDTNKLLVAKGLPIIGSIIPLINNLFQFFVKAYQQLDSIYKVCLPGRVLTVLGGPEANIFVSQNRINYFITREIYTDLAKELGVSLIAELDGEEHCRYRKIIEQFLSTNVDEYIKPMIQVILDLSKNWQLGQRWQVDDLIQKRFYSSTSRAS
jgi:cytochrome P450